MEHARTHRGGHEEQHLADVSPDPLVVAVLQPFVLGRPRRIDERQIAEPVPHQSVLPSPDIEVSERPDRAILVPTRIELDRPEALDDRADELWRRETVVTLVMLDTVQHTGISKQPLAPTPPAT